MSLPLPSHWSPTCTTIRRCRLCASLPASRILHSSTKGTATLCCTCLLLAACCLLLAACCFPIRLVVCLSDGDSHLRSQFQINSSPPHPPGWSPLPNLAESASADIRVHLHLARSSHGLDLPRLIPHSQHKPGFCDKCCCTGTQTQYQLKRRAGVKPLP